MIAAGAGIALVALMIVVLRGSSMNYWVTPEELASGSQAEGQMRVAGAVVADSINTDYGRLDFSIKAEGERAKLRVSYDGYVPRGFYNLSEVIVEGSLSGDTFQAQRILVRCPDNYLVEKAAISTFRAVGIEGALYR